MTVDVVYFVDVDNTLVDNDRLLVDLCGHIEAVSARKSATYADDAAILARRTRPRAHRRARRRPAKCRAEHVLGGATKETS